MSTINIPVSYTSGSWYSNWNSTSYGNSQLIYTRLAVSYLRSGNNWLVNIYCQAYRPSGSTTATISNNGSSALQTGDWSSRGYVMKWNITSVSSISTSSSSPSILCTFVSGGTLSGTSRATAYADVSAKYKITAVGGANFDSISDDLTIIGPRLLYYVYYYSNGEKVGGASFSYGSPTTIRAKESDVHDSGTYTLTYDVQGGNAVSPQTGKWNQTTSFSTWRDRFTGSTYNPGSTATFREDMYLDAVWSKGNPSYATLSVKNATKNNDKSEYSYAANFYNLGSYYGTTYSNTGNQTITYNPLKYYISNYNGLKYGGNEGMSSLTLMANTTLKAYWSYSISEKGPLKLSGLPSNPTRIGYKFAGWYDSGDIQIKNNMTMESDITAYSKWTNKTYSVQFIINGDAAQPGQWPNATKTYDISDVQIPAVTPKKLGYTFGGWTNETGTVPVQLEGQWLDDRIYNYITSQSGAEPTIVKLYAKWIPIQNKVYLHYYDDQGYVRTLETYTIENLKTYNNVQCYYVKEAPEGVSMGGDFVFIGWSTIDQLNEFYGEDGITKWNNDRGVYPNTDEAPKLALPYYIRKNEVTTADDWDTSDSNARNIYGIWSKTGKYIKLASGWKKVNTMYVKVGGVWRIVKEFSTCTQSAIYDDEGQLIQEAVWKTEI